MDSEPPFTRLIGSVIYLRLKVAMALNGSPQHLMGILLVSIRHNATRKLSAGTNLHCWRSATPNRTAQRVRPI